MCCGDKGMHGQCDGQGIHGAHHRGMGHGMCGCGGRMFLSKKEKIEMLEEYRESLKNELKGVEEEIEKLQTE